MVTRSTTAPPVPPDEAPDQSPDTPPERERDPEEDIPVDASTLQRLGEKFAAEGGTWKEGYRAATDNPLHPLRHLKDVGVHDPNPTMRDVGVYEEPTKDVDVVQHHHPRKE